MQEITLDPSAFKALSSSSRVKILKLLSKRRKTLSELAAEMGMAASSTKQHLDSLEGGGLVKGIDEGRKWKYFQLTPKGKAVVEPQVNPVRILFLLGIVVIAFILVVTNISAIKGVQEDIYYRLFSGLSNQQKNWTFSSLNLKLGQSALVVPPEGSGFRVSVDSAIIQHSYSYTDNSLPTPSTFVSYAGAGEVYYLFNFTEENASSDHELFFVQNFELQGSGGLTYNATTFWLITDTGSEKSGTLVFEAPQDLADPQITYTFGFNNGNTPVEAVWSLDKQAITPPAAFEAQMEVGQNVTFNEEDGLGDYVLSLTSLAYSSDAPGGLAYATFQVYHGSQSYSVSTRENSTISIGPSLELTVTGAQFASQQANASSPASVSSISVRLVS